VELRRYLEILWQRKWLLILTALIIMLIANIGSRYAAPVYKSTSKVLISTDPKTGLISSIPRELGTIRFFNKDFVVGTVEDSLKSESVVGRVIRDLNLRNSEGELFRAEEFTDQSTIGLIITSKKGVTVKNISDSNIIEINGYSTDPVESMDIANSISDVFFQKYYAYNSERAKAARIVIEKSLDDLEGRLTAMEEEEARFKAGEMVISINQQIEEAIGRLVGLEVEMNQARRSLKEAKSNYDFVKSALKQSSDSLSNLDTLSDNLNIVEYKKELLSLEMALASALTKMTPRHPEVESTKKQIDIVKENIKSEIYNSLNAETTAYYSLLIEKYVDAEINITSYTARLNVLKKQIDSLNGELRKMPDKEIKTVRFGVKIGVLRQRYTVLLTDLEIAKLAEMMSLANIEVIQPASLSDNIDDNRYFPKGRKKTFILSLVFGGFIGVFWVFLLEYLDETVRMEEEAHDALDQPVLGVVPKLNQIKRNIGFPDNNLTALNMFLILKSRIGIITSGKKSQILSVVSCQKKDGKSTIAAFLAYLFAESGEKVLLIDSNMHRPGINNILNLPISSGLSDFFQEDLLLKDVVKGTSWKNLDVISAGSIRNFSLGMIGSTKLTDMIELIKPGYDRIIFDTLPIEEGSDAIDISTRSDAVILVIESQKTLKRKAGRAVDLLREAKCETIGVILNKVRSAYR